jgi:ABC-type multidrug transport system ATPase subunit/ABC-type transport system involved in multi-copper enzyme maturation permease subunit
MAEAPGLVEAHELTKRFGGKVAVDHLSFTVEPGRVTGFLGPNGAGKSTTMRLITGLDRPDSGTATIGGLGYAQLSKPLTRVGALLEARSVHPGRSARNHLLFLAQTQGIPAKRADEMLDLVGLREVAGKRAGGFSLGMTQRLGIAAAMLGDPPVLMLDEPVNGLDPEGIRWVRTFMRQLASEGRTIFVSSHLMSEMAVTADHLVVIGRGALIMIVINNTWNSPGSHPNHLRLIEDPTAVLFGAGFGLGQLAICVLGVIVMSSEYSTGAIRASLLAVPTRIPMLAAKAIVFMLLDLVVSAVTVFAVFFITTAIIASHVPITLSQPGVARACVGGILYLTVLGLFSLAVGGLIRHTAGAIATVIGLVLVVPPLISLIPGTIANHVHGYLPNVAGQLVAQTSQQSGDVLSPWQGFGVFCLWTAVLLGACGYLLVRRDA